MSVTLAKLSDSSPAASPFASRQWQNTVKLASALYGKFGDRYGVDLYEGLSDNDLTALRDTFQVGYVNYPTGVKGQSHTTTYAPFGDDVAHVTFDYSDGYNGTYAVGE